MEYPKGLAVRVEKILCGFFTGFHPCFPPYGQLANHTVLPQPQEVVVEGLGQARPGVKAEATVNRDRVVELKLVSF